MSEHLHKSRIVVDTSQAEAAIKELGATANSTVETVAQLGTEAEKTGQRIEDSTKDASKETKNLKEEEDRLIDKTKQAGETFEKTGGKGSNAFSSIQNALKTIQLTSIIQQVQFVADGLGKLAEPAITFEQSMADLAAITGIAGEELKELERTARNVGKESGLGAAESARAFAILAGKIELPIDQLKKLQEQTILLAQAGAIPLETAATALSATINQFGLDADAASRITNVLAAASRAGSSEVNNLADSFKVVGSTAASAGMSVEDTAAVLEVLAGAETMGAEAGTSLRNMLISMQTVLGIDVQKQGFVGGLKAIKQHLDTITDPIERNTFLAKAFNATNIDAGGYLLKNIDAIEKMTETVTNTNSATEQAEIRNNTWAHSLEVIRAKMQDFQIQMNEATGGILPFFAGVTEQLVPFSQVIPLLSSAGSGFSSLFNIVKASPFGKWGLIIAGVAGALTVLYKNSEEFRNLCGELWNSVKELTTNFMEALRPALHRVSDTVRELLPTFQHIIQMLGQHLSSILRQLAPIFANLVRAISPLIPTILDLVATVGKFVGQVIEALSPAIQGIMSLLQEILPYVAKFGEFFIKHIITVVEIGVGWIKKLIGWIKELFGITEKANGLGIANEKETKAIEEQTAALKELHKERQDIIDLMNVPQMSESNKKRLQAQLHEVTYKIDQKEKEIAESKEKPVLQADIAIDLAQITSKIENETIENPLQLNGRMKSFLDEDDNSKIKNRTTLIGLENTIAELEERKAKASFADAAEIQKQIDEAQKQLDIEKQIIEVVSKHGAAIESFARRVLSSDDALQKEVFILEYLKKQKVDLVSIEGLTNNLNALQKQIAGETGERQIKLQKQANELQKQIELKKELLALEAKHGKGAALVAKALHISGDENGKKNFKELEKNNFKPLTLSEAGQKGMLADLNKTIEKNNEKQKKLLGSGKRNWKEKIGDIQDSLMGLGSVFSSINDMIGEGGNEWLKWGATVLGTIAQVLPELATLFQANLGVAASEAGKSQAGIPVVGPVLAAAGIASVVAAIVNHPKPKPFAEGGIVSGPTNALVAEYEGASQNPEVIMPLDRLQDFIDNDRNNNGGGVVSFEIKGRKLLGVLEKENNRRRF